MKITIELIAACYEIAKKVYEKEVYTSQNEGIKDLVARFNMNKSSATVYVRVFEHLMEGERFTRTLSTKSMEYYLENIFKDYGPSKLSVALSSLLKHIEYFEKIENVNMRSVRKVYESYFSEIPTFPKDELEQQEIEKYYQKTAPDRNKIILELNNLKDTDPEITTVNRRAYKRDNKTVAQIKFLRDYKCQICSTSILKKDGSKYIEAAHIKPKNQKGRESPSNIILLCPNHHKEFDFGDLIIKQQSNTNIVFSLNGQNHTISLAIS